MKRYNHTVGFVLLAVVSACSSDGGSSTDENQPYNAGKGGSPTAGSAGSAQSGNGGIAGGSGGGGQSQAKEETADECADGKDNDGDGKTDCDDPTCKAAFGNTPLCSGSGGTSSGGNGGTSTGGNGSGNKEETADECSDGKDNDNDGKTDCDDPACKVAFGSTPLCDGSGSAGKGGSAAGGSPAGGAGGSPGGKEETADECADGKDNDSDGKTDCDDPACIANFFSSLCKGGNGGSSGSSSGCTEEKPCFNGAACLDGQCVDEPDWSPGPDPSLQGQLETVSEAGGSGEIQSWGSILGTFCNVPAYSNANSAITGCAYSNARTDGVNKGKFGFEYQCVEYAFRFLCTVYDAQLGCLATGKGASQKYGNAYAWYDNLYNHPVLSKSKIDRFKSGETTVAPQQGDALIFGTACYPGTGHVAIVQEVGADYVKIIEQNFTCDGQDGGHVLKLNQSADGKYSIKCATGWMRVIGGGPACAVPLPTLLSPPDAQSFTSGQDIDFSWSLGDVTKDHTFKIRDLDSNQIVIETPIGKGTSYTWKSAPNGNYRWTVYYAGNCQDGQCAAPARTLAVTSEPCSVTCSKAGKNCGSYLTCNCGTCNAAIEACQNNVCTALACSQTCASGCCAGNTCMPGSGNSACGSGGQACADCNSQQNPPNAQCWSATASCASATCQYTKKNAGSSCDDGDPCTQNDVCNGSGTCSGTQKSCSGHGICNGGTCECSGGYSGPDCSTPPNPCNGKVCDTPPGPCYNPVGTCDPGTGQCSYSFKTNGSTCNDGNSCSTNDVCDGNGSCSGTQNNCNNHGSCSGGACTCNQGFDSAVDCGQCSAGYTNYPSCTKACSVTSSPGVGNPTGGVANTSCTCPGSGQSYCHSLYSATVTNISMTGPKGPQATISYSKLGGGTINAGTKYWIEPISSSVTPTCNQLNAYQPDRLTGTFGSSSSSQSLTVNIWPDQASYDNALPGDTKCLIFITDGSTTPNTRTWFQYQQTCFTKGC